MEQANMQTSKVDKTSQSVTNKFSNVVHNEVSASSILPRHVAIVMDGNGRWAAKRNLPRIEGHRAGVDVVRAIVEACIELKINVLTLFAFSSENWRRPSKEVEFLMNLFSSVLQKEAEQLHENNVQLRVIGERDHLDKSLVSRIETAEVLTKNNTGLKLILSANYGGRWDIVQAVKQLAKLIKQGKLEPENITEHIFEQYLSLANLPEPDLFIRTSGEIRISNFLIWQLAYTEMYFTEVLWPDFTRQDLVQAFSVFAKRHRRYGQIDEQAKRV